MCGMEGGGRGEGRRGGEGGGEGGEGEVIEGWSESFSSQGGRGLVPVAPSIPTRIASSVRRFRS